MTDRLLLVNFRLFSKLKKRDFVYFEIIMDRWLWVEIQQRTSTGRQQTKHWHVRRRHHCSAGTQWSWQNHHNVHVDRLVLCCDQNYSKSRPKRKINRTYEVHNLSANDIEFTTIIFHSISVLTFEICLFLMTAFYPSVAELSQQQQCTLLLCVVHIRDR